VSIVRINSPELIAFSEELGLPDIAAGNLAALQHRRLLVSTTSVSYQKTSCEFDNVAQAAS